MVVMGECEPLHPCPRSWAQPELCNLSATVLRPSGRNVLRTWSAARPAGPVGKGAA
jgi:hypothetical protein